MRWRCLASTWQEQRSHPHTQHAHTTHNTHSKTQELQVYEVEMPGQYLAGKEVTPESCIYLESICSDAAVVRRNNGCYRCVIQAWLPVARLLVCNRGGCRRPAAPPRRCAATPAATITRPRCTPASQPGAMLSWQLTQMTFQKRTRHAQTPGA